MADYSRMTRPLKDCNAFSQSLSFFSRERGMKKVWFIYQGKTECNKNNCWFLKLLIFRKVILFPISNLELSLWQNNIKLHRVLCLCQINHIGAFDKYKRSKRVVQLFDSDQTLWPSNKKNNEKDLTRKKSTLCFRPYF